MLVISNPACSNPLQESSGPAISVASVISIMFVSSCVRVLYVYRMDGEGRCLGISRNGYVSEYRSIVYTGLRSILRVESGGVQETVPPSVYQRLTRRFHRPMMDTSRADQSAKNSAFLTLSHLPEQTAIGFLLSVNPPKAFQDIPNDVHC